MYPVPEYTSKTNFVLGESTVLGIAHAAKAWRDRLTFRTVFWAIIFVFSSGVTGWACYLVLDDYLGYPVVSVMETKLNKILEFPSVAFCNLNPVPCRSLYERSLDYPTLWEESGCSLGKQASPEISAILVTYQKMYGKIPPNYDVLNTKLDLLNFIAFTFVDSITARQLLYDRNMTTLINDLDAFLLSYYTPQRLATRKGAVMKFHVSNLMRLAKNHVWFAQLVSPTIKANFAITTMAQSTNETTLLVLVRAYRDIAMVDGTMTDYGPYTTAVDFWTEWETAIMAGKAPAVTALQKAVMDKASAGFSIFLNRTISVISKNPMVSSVPFLYTDAIIPALIMALQRNAIVSNQQLDASLQQTIDKLQFFAGALIQKLPSTAELISSKSSLVGDIFTDMFISMPVQEQQSMAVTYGQFFLSCSFKGIPCGESDFMKFMNTKYGQCFIFNSDMRKVSHANDEANTSVIGAAGGLMVKLNVEDDQYIRSGFRETSGARIAIMAPRTPPNVFDSGYSVPPGQEVSFELKQRDIDRLPDPYPSDCVTFWNETAYSIYDLAYDYKACLRFCKIHEIYDECKCVEQGYLKEFTIKGMGLDYVPYCLQARRDNQTACVERVKERNQDPDSPQAFHCSCKPACSEREYEVVTSSALYPSLSYSEFIGSKFNVHEIMIGQNWETLRRNYVKVNVYFSAFDSLSTREEAKYSVFSLAGNVGGAASLMLGICGVTILEVIIMLWDIGMDCISRRGKSSTAGNTVESFNPKADMMQKNPGWGMPAGYSGMSLPQKFGPVSGIPPPGALP